MRSKSFLGLLAVGAFLLAQACWVRLAIHQEAPSSIPLSEMSVHFAGWQAVDQLAGETGPQQAQALHADDAVTRVFRSPQHLGTVLLAYFHRQDGNRQPHSPRVCLPANGWTALSTETVSLSKDSLVNRLLISNGSERAAAVYWYETPTRSIAGEFELKARLAIELLRGNRSDVALARIMVPVRDGDDGAALAAAFDLARKLAPAIRGHYFRFPVTETARLGG